MKLLLALLLAPLGFSQQGTLELQCNPINMKSLGKISGLGISEAGLWNCVGRNNSSSTVNVDWEDLQLAFPSINFLNSFESNLLLTQKQKESIWKSIADLAEDGMLGASAFVSPWFLVAKPVLDKINGQIVSRVPNEDSLIGRLSVTSFTVAPTAKFNIMLLAGLMARADVHFYKKTLFIEPQPMTTPPALLKEGPTSSTHSEVVVEQPVVAEFRPVPWVWREAMGMGD